MPPVTAVKTTKKEFVPEAERIPLREKIGFSLGANMDLVSNSLLIGLFMPIFNIGLGMTPVAIGIVLMLLRGWDAITDPVMGYITDNIRTRWGRRRPYMVIGAIGCALIYPIFWFMPADASDNTKFIYLLLVGMAYYTASTCWCIPYYGMQMELTPNYHERTRLAAWMSAFYKTVAIAGGWTMALISSSYFADPVTGKPDLVNGMQHLCWVFAVLLLVFGLSPAIFVRERDYGVTVSADGRVSAPREPFWKNIRESIENKPLWILIGVSFLVVIGSSAVGAVGNYVSIYYVNQGDLAMAGIVGGWKGTVITVSSIALIPFWTWLGRSHDKRTIVITMLSVTIFGHLLGYFLMTPKNPYLSIIPGFFESAAMSAVWLFLPSMKGDVADYDEQLTHRRREGSINSFYSWFFKAALTLSAGLGGWVLQSTGFDVKVNASDPVIHWRMFMVYLFLPLFFWVAAIVLIWIYPLTRVRMEAIRLENEARRGPMRTAV
jgi:GPH family glycoside/pentoside/hexuronide:cation symporter